MDYERIKIQPNFYLDEFGCKCCGGVFDLDRRIPEKAQELRDWLGKAFQREICMKITSGCRCLPHHRRIYEEINKEREARGATPIRVPMGSRHLRGRGIDVQLFDSGGQIVHWTDDMIEAVGALFWGIGTPASRDWLHMDLRSNRAEWDYIGQ